MGMYQAASRSGDGVRILQRSLQPFWYRLYETIAPDTYTDEWGNVVESGEQTVGYSAPVQMYAHISPASGASDVEMFGNLDNYDKVIVTADMTCPIDENSVLYIDTTPTETDGEWSAYNYIVRRVARSINSISIAVRKVEVS